MCFEWAVDWHPDDNRRPDGSNRGSVIRINPSIAHWRLGPSFCCTTFHINQPKPTFILKTKQNPGVAQASPTSSFKTKAIFATAPRFGTRSRRHGRTGTTTRRTASSADAMTDVMRRSTNCPYGNCAHRRCQLYRPCRRMAGILLHKT